MDNDTLKIGTVTERIRLDTDALLVPNILFHENPRQSKILQSILKDFQLGLVGYLTILGEHILLIGNQGVGKNKLADYFLQLLNLPRQYLQLHRQVLKL